LLALLSAGLFLPSLCAQNTKEYMTVGELPKVAGKRGATLQVKIPLTVKEGYHVNSNAPLEESLIPLKLTWTSTGALEGGTVTYPKPAIEKYEFSDKISVYTGSFDLVSNFKVGAKAPAGPGVATGKLKYQACSTRACYPPKTIDVALSYHVE